MKFTKLTLSLIILINFLIPKVTFAHQSGCHRWHSCPSDTGSYECGDTGYDTYCNDEEYYEEPDYTVQGQENGTQQASDDSSSITTVASKEGETDGYEDGLEGSSEDNSPDSDSTCIKTFTFDGPANDEYQDSFYDAYSSACAETYDNSYSSAYAIGYERGYEEYKQGEKEEASNTTENNNTWVWPSLLGGGAILYGASQVSDAKKKSVIKRLK